MRQLLSLVVLGVLVGCADDSSSDSGSGSEVNAGGDAGPAAGGSADDDSSDEAEQGAGGSGVRPGAGAGAGDDGDDDGASVSPGAEDDASGATDDRASADDAFDDDGAPGGGASDGDDEPGSDDDADASSDDTATDGAASEDDSPGDASTSDDGSGPGDSGGSDPDASDPDASNPDASDPGTGDPDASTSSEPLPCTQLFEGSSASALGSVVSEAAPGSVICIPSGTAFDGTLRLGNSAASADERVTLCASGTGDECGGGENPNFSGGIVFDQAYEGLVLRDLDVRCDGRCPGVGVDLAGASHIRMEGGTVSGWEQGFACNSFIYDEPCDGIEIGMRDNLTELTGNVNGFFGWLSNSYLRLDAHDNGDGTVFTHHWYLSSGPQDAPSTNVVFEYGRYTRSSVADGVSLGTFLNLSGQNRDIVIRHNTFDDSSCGTYLIDCSAGGEEPEEFCDGVEIYGNEFVGNCPLNLHLQSTQRARVYNNVFATSGTLAAIYNGERPATDGWFFNNTVFCAGGCETSLWFEGDEHRVFNNLFSFGGGQAIVEGGNQSCGLFGGAAAPGLHHNFLYAPGSGPRFPACGEANSESFDLDPGFASPESGDFHIEASSPAAGFADSADAPATDFDGRMRPDPPAAGAFDVN